MAKKYLPFEDENWNQIVEDAFAPDAEVHVFSSRYQKRKKKLMKKDTQKKPILRRKSFFVAAAAVATAVVIPTSVFAGSRIYTAFMEQPAEYQRDITIDLGQPSEASALSNEGLVMDSGIYTMNIGWIPEDLSLEKGEEDSSFVEYARYEIDEWRAVAFTFFEIDDESRTFNETLKGVVSDETYETDRQIVFRADMGDDRTEIWVAFKGTKYVANILAMEEFSDDELRQMTDGLTLEASDREVAASYKQYKAQSQAELQEAANADEYEYTGDPVDMSRKQLVAIGEPANVNDVVDITVNSVRLQDNFDGITTEGIGLEYDYSKYLDADGTLADNVRTWYTYGDGVNTIDEAVETENMPAHVMVVNLTYENKGSEEIEYCVCPYLFGIDEKGNMIRSHFIRDGMYCEDSLGHLTCDDMHFSFYTEHETIKNNIASFKPGEKAEVQLAFIVYDEELSNTYLDLTGGSSDLVLDLRYLAE